ncbi:QueT transporter family protein [Butyrivibrio sp. VCB2006]|uniref:QueT transporter family protein n=1 Tax=Butyrivibrio sp. VCB2006 TaxID=1280679 RepID=UPI0004048BDB|nr:QueT transporter family protein [Butyrivibrio sp. VCB2006]
MRNKNVLFITQAAAIAALYVVLTLLANALGLANYAIQVRFSEALTILPYFTPAAIPGLFLGCIISNTLTGCMLLDTIFGSLATLVGALVTYFIAHGFKTPGHADYYCKSNIKKWLCPIPPIVANVLVVPPVLLYVYHLEGTLPFFMLTVGIGEVISCYLLGMILLHALEPRKENIFRQNIA